MTDQPDANQNAALKEKLGMHQQQEEEENVAAIEKQGDGDLQENVRDLVLKNLEFHEGNSSLQQNLIEVAAKLCNESNKYEENCKLLQLLSKVAVKLFDEGSIYHEEIGRLQESLRLVAVKLMEEIRYITLKTMHLKEKIDLEKKYQAEKSDLEKKYKQLEEKLKIRKTMESQVVTSSTNSVTAAPQTVRKLQVISTNRVAPKVKELLTFSRNGNEAEVRSIIASGADVNIVDDTGKTPLHYAAQHGHVSVCEALLNNGAYTDVEDDEDDTPVLKAYFHGHVHVMKLFTARGASVSKINKRMYPSISRSTARTYSSM